MLLENLFRTRHFETVKWRSFIQHYGWRTLWRQMSKNSLLHNNLWKYVNLFDSFMGLNYRSAWNCTSLDRIVSSYMMQYAGNREVTKYVCSAIVTVVEWTRYVIVNQWWYYRMQHNSINFLLAVSYSALQFVDHDFLTLKESLSLYVIFSLDQHKWLNN